MAFKIEMSRKSLYSMLIKILQLWLVFVSSFKEFVEFSLSNAIAEIVVTNKILV